MSNITRVRRMEGPSALVDVSFIDVMGFPGPMQRKRLGRGHEAPGLHRMTSALIREARTWEHHLVVAPRCRSDATALDLAVDGAVVPMKPMLGRVTEAVTQRRAVEMTRRTPGAKPQEWRHRRRCHGASFTREMANTGMYASRVPGDVGQGSRDGKSRSRLHGNV
jgi:hypothetical protein